jgi:ATP-dependent DNA ligase
MLTPPIEPMLAAPLGHELPPPSDDVAFEPKWDGFRCLLFRSDAGVVLQGRGRSRTSADEVVDLAYAFPEICAAAIAQLPPGTVVDGEIVIERDGRLDFGALTSRLRPRSAAEQATVTRLASEIPAVFLAFDVLWRDADVMALPFSRRREVLEGLAADWVSPLLLTPSTRDRDRAWSWFTGFESAGVDGLIAKRLTDPYLPGARAQGKVKHQRTADVVVAGWRPHTKPGSAGQPVVGSLLLGLHDSAGTLHYVGASSAFTAAVRASLVDELAPLSVGDDDAHPWRSPTRARVPGGPSRWKKEQPWTALRPERVLEVSYDQMEGDRFRHVAGFVRWRPDRDPPSCGYDQLEVPPAARIDGLLRPIP